MSELRLDPLTRRWVVIAADRASRPGDFPPRTAAATSADTCPFCPGHEEQTLPAVGTYERDGRWRVRVVPNLYPALGSGSEHVREDHGPIFHRAPGVGAHEVIVTSPKHHAGWADFDDAQAGLVMAAIRDRIVDHAANQALHCTLAIVNHGREAGASLEHPHGQLLALPFVPEQVEAEIDGFAAHEEPCLLCTALLQEEAVGDRLLLADDRVAVVCPYWSGTPYEMLVIPRHHVADVPDAAPDDVAAVGRAIRDALAMLARLVGDAAYNLVVHTAPHRSTGPFHWHVHVYPRLTTAAAFEAATGVMINVVSPEQAAAALRRA